ncbi:hypothetical protein CZ674_04795 [Agrococcus casei LMG 22410]|uniref:PIN domain-containing protein n=1 Tax=Agrococcus casei LMG 22410 TaxID=1255656 RepID=A0A1R4FJI8_9MICO|nr:hypothetical protein CZ674_04795 [Agrococcus casei LMG 22410]
MVFSAVLDTSVLWPSLQRDFLLSLAAENTYSPKWSTAILDELVFHEAEKLVRRGTATDEAERTAKRLIGQMSTVFDDALVTDWEPLDGTYGLPDPDDEHVLAAAVMCSAEVIVTENLKHFPASKLPAQIRAVPARDFVYDTVRAHLTQSCRAVMAICDRSGRRGPKLSAADLLTILEDRYKMTKAVELLAAAPALREHLD